MFFGEPSDLYVKITVQGTGRLLRESQGFQVEQFIFSSTLLVHAPTEPGGTIHEDSPMQPKWDYPKSKVETEKLILGHRGTIPVVLARIAGVYDGQGRSIPLTHQIQRICERRLTSKVFPAGISRGRSFIHLEEVFDSFGRIVEPRSFLPPELPLLIGEPETVGYDELQRDFGRLIHKEEWETRRIGKVLAKTGAWLQDLLPFGEEPFIKPWMVDLADDHYSLDISRAKEVLGWAPIHSLCDSIPKMVEAPHADPAKFYQGYKLGEAPMQFEK